MHHQVWSISLVLGPHGDQRRHVALSDYLSYLQAQYVTSRINASSPLGGLED